MTPMAAWRECGRAGAYTVTRDTPTSPCRPRDAFRPATSNSPDRYRIQIQYVNNYTIIYVHKVQPGTDDNDNRPEDPKTVCTVLLS